MGLGLGSIKFMGQYGRPPLAFSWASCWQM